MIELEIQLGIEQDGDCEGFMSWKWKLGGHGPRKGSPARRFFYFGPPRDYYGPARRRKGQARPVTTPEWKSMLSLWEIEQRSDWICWMIFNVAIIRSYDPFSP